MYSRLYLRIGKAKNIKMEAVFDNISTLFPFMAIPWVMFIAGVLWRPQKYFNSILLMISLFFTMFFVAGIFGSHMKGALLTMVVIVLIILLLVPAMLIYNGIIMIKKESVCFAHILSLILGILVGAGEIATFVYAFQGPSEGIMYMFHKAEYFVSSSVFYFSILILNFVVYSVFIQLLPHRYNFNYVIIHGCGLIDGYKVSKLLADRVDKAIEIYEKCSVKPMIIPSGGKGDDESLSEAEAMAEYLIEKGIPKEHILIEAGSATTMENLIYSKEIIDAREGKKKTALVSSNYHIYRCLKYAKKVNLKCVGIGAKVALYYWPTALIREFVAVFKEKKFFFFAMAFYLLFMWPIVYM